MQPVDTPRIFSNRYELTHLIARGGMAQVYRARDRLLDRPVALKVLFPELSVDRAFVERFRREAQAAANLSHPNIVPVYDWGEDSGTYFIVMEFVAGQPLSAMLRNGGPLDPIRVADIGAHVAAALAFAHRNGVIHRDVKPGNVLITDDGQVKVTDFGIARAINTEESLTQTGAVMGTAAYFSPEQAEGIGVDSRSDLYSLGVVLFEMITGRTPFVGDSPVAVASKHVRDLPPLPRDFNPAVPVALEAVVMKAMAKSPEQRYASADELRADLLRFTAGQPVTAEDAAVTRVAMAAPVASTAALLGAGSSEGATGPVATVATPVSTAGPSSSAALVPTVAAAALVASPVASPVGGSATLGVSTALSDRRKARNRRLLIILLLLIAAVVVVAVLLLRSLGYLGGGNFPLPNVVGLSASNAKTTLLAKGLVVNEQAESSNQPIGVVVKTVPVPQAEVKKGNIIVLDVSTGPAATIPVPNIVGQNLEDAIITLKADNLGYTIEPAKSTAPSGTVIKQSPAAGVTVPPHNTVVLTVSSQSQVAVPTLVGVTQLVAGSSLNSKSLTVGMVTTMCSMTNVANNDVISTSPVGGTLVAPGSAVNLVLSTGPCNVAVQDVVTEPQALATTNLQGQQLVPSVTTITNGPTCMAAQNGDVTAQNPAAGTMVKSGSTVTITVCNYSVPANTVVVKSPGPQTSVTAVAITPLQITATDSGGSSVTLVYSDGSTLPAGLSINPSTGVITGTPTTVGTFVVTITVTDSTGVTGTVNFKWTVTA